MTDYSEFAPLLLSWYRENKRILPWRTEVSPYRTWISEIMLQQTRVEAVKGYFERFLAVLPGVYELAAVPDEVLMKLWQGLGYYTRARNLKRAAQEIVARFSGQLPDDTDLLLSLPGIGRYTAAAIASIAYGRRAAAVDGNVLRVYARVFGDGRDIADPATKTAYEAALLTLMPQESGTYAEGQNDCGDFTQGMIELGATVCVPNGKPNCPACPLRSLCEANRTGAQSLLPVKRKKASRKIEDRTVLLLTDGTRYAICKRPENGLLAGLYEPLNLAGRLTPSAVITALTALGIPASAVRAVEPIGEAKHIFTHIEWHMTGYRVLVHGTAFDAPMMFRTPEEIRENDAIPSAFRAFMKHLKESDTV